MKSTNKMVRSDLLKIAVMATLSATSTTAMATTYDWNQTAAGGYNWNNPANWVGGVDFPNAVGDVANINTNVVAGAGAVHAVYLRQDITIGSLAIGDAAASGTSYPVLIGNFPGQVGPPELPPDPAYVLTIDNGAAPASIAVGVTGTPTNTISTPVVLNSNLNIDMGPTASLNNTNRQQLSFTGSSFNAGSNNITISGGFGVLGNNPGANQSTVTFGPNTDLIGSGTITVNDRNRLEISGTPTPAANPSAPIPPKSFTGKIVLNSRVNGSVSASLGLINGSLANASEIEVNGHFVGLGTNNLPFYGEVQTPGNTGNGGGSIWVSSGTAQAYRPGQRLTSNKLTFNGGSLIYGGQAINDNEGQWQAETIAVVRLNSGNSFISLASHANTPQRITATNLERGAGATLQYKVSSSTSQPPQMIIGTAPASFMKSEVGGNPGTGTAGTPTVGIVPWIAFGNVSGYGMNGFATYDSTVVDGGQVGLRALAANEFVNTIASAADSNYRGNGNLSLAVIGDISVNSLQHTATGATPTNIGAGRTLTIKSGGLMFTGGAYGSLTNGSIGVVGDPAAGTINFGSAEAVIWNGLHSNQGGVSGNTIGSALTGTGGLTKTGSGILVLAGTNSITGDTHVGAGALKVGDGTVAGNSSIGNGDVFVHGGAVLDLVFAGADTGDTIDFINDAKTLTLVDNGSVNGRLSIVAGIETVMALIVGGESFGPGYYGSQAASALYGSTPEYASLNITSSAALDQYFMGNGLIQVIPEPATLTMLGMAAFGFLRRKR